MDSDPFVVTDHDFDVVSHAPGGKQSHDGARPEELFGFDAIEKGEGVGVENPGLLPCSLVGQKIGKTALDLPRLKERCPINVVYDLDERITMEIKGRHLIEGVPKTITVSDEEIREALAETVNVIVDAVRVALERTPPELSADIVDRGIVLTGGGSLLKNLDKRLREETGLPVAMADDPLSSVVLGAGQMLSEFGLLRKISID